MPVVLASYNPLLDPLSPIAAMAAQHSLLFLFTALPCPLVTLGKP